MKTRMLLSLMMFYCLSTLLFGSCKEDVTVTEEPIVNLPRPIPDSDESGTPYVFTKEGVITLAVMSGLAYEESISKIKDYLAYFQAELSPSTLANWENDTVWVEVADDVITYRSQNSNGSHAGQVVIGNVIEFTTIGSNPYSNLVHYLALAYYEKYMDESEKTSITNRYDQVKITKYNKVYMSNGTKLVMNQIPDASISAVVYFAELSEAYFGENDYYPFDYHELERYDKPMFDLLTTIWGARTIATNPHGITLPPLSLKQWLEYKESDLDLYYGKYLDAGGLPIVSSRFVSDEALVQAQYIVNTMLKNIPESKNEMLKAHFRVGIIGAYENVTDMPENRMMNVWWPGTDWDARGRGYGATEFLPLMSCGEENIIKIPNYTERYPYESIMVHEFAHNVDFGLRKGRAGFTQALIAAYNNAKDTGLWAGTYSMENDAEYWAEGSQAWFDNCNMYVMINGVSTRLKTREQLRDYDFVLYNLMATVYPEETLTGYHFNYE